MNKFKRAAAAVLASAMVLALTACDEETPAAGSNAGTSNAAAPDANANAVVTTPLVTTTYDTDPAVQEAVEGAAASLDNPDLKVDKRIKWMAWWDIDETTAAAELFKKAYGIPSTGDDPSREGRIFEYINVAYGERYDKLATAIQSGDNKYTIDGYNPENEFVVSTGTPIVSNVNGVITNNMYDANVERAMDLLSTLQKENLRYPRHELNGWSVNPKAWAQGDTLFYGNGGTWEFEGDSGLNRFAQRFGWSDDEICVVPYPRDPQADKYYHFMKQDALMWCKGSTNDAGVAAWIDCNVTASLDPATTAASIAQSKEKNGWSDYNLDFIYSQTTLDGTSKLTPIFDFKNGLGTDIASADTADSNVEQLTKYVYIQGEQSYTQLREANFAVIDARINEINEAIKNLT